MGSSSPAVVETSNAELPEENEGGTVDLQSPPTLTRAQHGDTAGENNWVDLKSERLSRARQATANRIERLSRARQANL
jgi:hypothetical protein